MKESLIGNKDLFAIEYAFFEGDDSHDTEISMYVEGKNILAFDRDGEHLTTRWNLDELAEWLRQFIDNMAEDPFPVECEGQFAAQKDDNARDFDSDDDDVLEAYYEKLYDWNLRHRWHSACSGAILADVYFQLVKDDVEVSWNNEGEEDGVAFQHLNGGAKVKRDVFYSVVDAFLKEYTDHWFS